MIVPISRCFRAVPNSAPELFIANITDAFFGLHERETAEHPLPPPVGPWSDATPRGRQVAESRCIGFRDEANGDGCVARAPGATHCKQARHARCFSVPSGVQFDLTQAAGTVYARLTIEPEPVISRLG